MLETFFNWFLQGLFTGFGFWIAYIVVVAPFRRWFP